MVPDESWAKLQIPFGGLDHRRVHLPQLFHIMGFHPGMPADKQDVIRATHAPRGSDNAGHQSYGRS
jgi:hypothetical protein